MQETCNRTFNWISSVTGNADQLEKLSNAMAQFYGEMSHRDSYQKMLDGQDNFPAENSPADLFVKRLAEDKKILEVGCGGGRIYQHLKNIGYQRNYFGVEVSPEVIERNRQAFPQATWECASAYALPFSDESFDVCFSSFVIEHLVYPEKSLREMLRVTRKGGKITLNFPDFVESGQFPSQLLGFSPGLQGSEKLKKGKLFDGMLSLYDSRIRLPQELINASQKYGPFPVNTRPLCLYYPDLMYPDVDAVYIASKKEIQTWAKQQGLRVVYPKGREGDWRINAWMEIYK